MATIEGQEIDLMPTEGMKEEAQRYRDWKAEGRDGGTEVAARRAGQILGGDELSADTVITMAAWFARHEVDKQGEGFSPGEDGYPSPGRVAWAAWGGDAGQEWATSKADRIKAIQERSAVDSERPYPNEHAARLTDPEQYDSLRRENDAGGSGIDFIYGIKEGVSEIQAIRFRSSQFTPAEAREWLAENDFDPIMFEEATGDGEADRAAPGELSEGDFVQWDSSGGTARGRIEHVMREGTLGVPDTEFSIDASAEDPAALIRIYSEGDEGWEATETLVGHKFSTLTKIAALRSLTGKYQRAELTSFDEVEERTFEFPFSSEYPVARYFGNEILSHESKAADLSRLNDGAPLLFNHNPDRVIGVVERAYIDGNKRRGYARVRFSRNSFAQEILSDVKDGVLRNVSFGYSIDKMEERGSGDFVATAWSPYEISVVSVPADPGVGIGRSLEDDNAASAAPTPDPIPSMENTTPDLAVVRAEAAEAERARISDITSLCTKHGMEDLGRQMVESGRSIDEARAAVLDKLNIPQETVTMQAADIGLSEKESRSFSFLRAINYLSNPTDRSAREAAAFEIEASEAAAAKLGRQSRGITIPQDVLRRDLNVGTASAGGNLVATDLDAGSFIDLLRNASALDQAGATVLTGLTGNVAIPRQSGAATAYWVAESGSPTESQQTVDQVSLVPRTVAAYTDFSRRLMIQSSIDVENMVRSDLASVIALKIDAAGLYGTGSNSEPLGLKNTTGIGTEDFAAAAPTFAEVVALESDVATANALLGTPVYLMNAAMRGNLKTTKKDAGSGIFIMENGEVNGYRGVLSNQVASGDLWFGNFADLIIGYFSGLDLMVDPYTHSTSGTVRVVAMQDCDIAIRHPESFSRGNDTL
jgi:HK97 family phage major capsid protein/HK97 family phage prohead protease